MLRRTLPIWRDTRDVARVAESLVVVVVEYCADGQAIERAREQLPPRVAEPRAEARRTAPRAQAGVPA